VMDMLQEPDYTRPIYDIFCPSRPQTPAELGDLIAFLLVTLPDDFKLFVQWLEFESLNFSEIYNERIWIYFTNMPTKKLSQTMTFLKPIENHPSINYFSLSYIISELEDNISYNSFILRNNTMKIIGSYYSNDMEALVNNSIGKLNEFTSSFQFAMWMFQLADDCRNNLNINLPYLLTITELDMNAINTFPYPDNYPEEGKISLLSKDLLKMIVSLFSENSLFPYRLVSKKWNNVIKSMLPNHQIIIARPRLYSYAFFIYNEVTENFRQLEVSRVSCHYYKPGDHLVVFNKTAMTVLLDASSEEIQKVAFESFMKHKPLGPNTLSILLSLTSFGYKSTYNVWEDYSDDSLIHCATLRLT